jgi:hypothetical protein
MFPFRQCRDGFSQPMIRGEHAVVTMPMLPRRRDEIGQPVILGLILAYPMLAALRITLDHIGGLSGWAILLSDEG